MDGIEAIVVCWRCSVGHGPVPVCLFPYQQSGVAAVRVTVPARVEALGQWVAVLASLACCQVGMFWLVAILVGGVCVVLYAVR